MLLLPGVTAFNYVSFAPWRELEMQGETAENRIYDFPYKYFQQQQSAREDSLMRSCLITLLSQFGSREA